jgi:hypothetical protein
MLGTRDSWNAGDDEDLGSSKVKRPPTTLAARVIAGATMTAVRASPSVLDPWSQADLDVLVNEIDILHAHALGVDAQGPSQ